MTEYFTFDGHRFRTYLFHIFCVLAILSAAGCGDQTSDQGTSEPVTPAAADTGSASFSIQWHTASTDRDPAGGLTRQAIESCGDAGVVSITCDVYSESNTNTPIASGGPWPCDAHGGRIEKIAAGANRTFAVLGWNAADGGGDVVYQGQTAGITITAGAIADAGTIDAYAFVPTELAPTAVFGNRIDLAWGDLGLAGVTGYRIYRDGDPIAESTSPAYSDPDLSPNTQYCYTISALDGFGYESGQSDPVCQTTSETSIWYRDGDEDGYGNPADSTQAASQPEGYVPDNTDCNDASASVHPGATETCNAVDDNCDGTLDEGVQNTYYSDSDGDGFGDTSNPTQACAAPEGYVADNTDCRDNNASVHPGATETCNQIDDDCDGSTDEGVQNTYYRDADGDNYGDPNSPTHACAAPEGYVTDNTDCRDDNAAINPGATEIADEIDNDCDGSIDEDLNTYYRDADEDGYGNPDASTQAASQPSGYVLNRTDCNDANAAVHPGATETCNAIDDNCDGSTDEGVQNTYYRDADGDQFGDASQTTHACTVPTGYVTDNTDCRDNNAAVHPGAIEICHDQLDNNCNGQTDEDCLACYPNLATPELALTDKQTYSFGSGSYTIYYLTVINRAEYPDDMFALSADYPACIEGNGSRTIVEIYDSESNLITELCDFTSPDDLATFSFIIYNNRSYPESAYIRIVDRECDHTYLSNSVANSLPVVGSWEERIDINCDGGAGINTLTFYADHTFDSVPRCSDYTGTWSLQGNIVTFSYTDCDYPVYSGTINEAGTQMEGTMGDGEHCWSATKN